MRKKLVDIEWDNPIRRDYEAGFLYGARFSKDAGRTVIFAAGAGKNEAKVFDNDSDGKGSYRELCHLADNHHPILCLDTSPSGKTVAMGTSQGKVLITPYAINRKGGNDEDDEFANLSAADKLVAIRALKYK